MSANVGCGGIGQSNDLFAPYRWGTAIELERNRRIRLLKAAYAYEVLNEPIISDEEFDRLAKSSNPSINTGKYDEWWRENFQPHTGQWIWKFPEVCLPPG